MTPLPATPEPSGSSRETSSLGQMVDRYGVLGLIVAGLVGLYQAAPEAVPALVKTYGLPAVIAGAGAILTIALEGQVIWWLARELRRVQEARVQELASIQEARVKDAGEVLEVVLRLSDRTREVVDRVVRSDGGTKNGTPTSTP